MIELRLCNFIQRNFQKLLRSDQWKTVYGS